MRGVAIVESNGRHCPVHPRSNTQEAGTDFGFHSIKVDRSQPGSAFLDWPRIAMCFCKIQKFQSRFCLAIILLVICIGLGSGVAAETSQNEPQISPSSASNAGAPQEL